MRVIVTGSHGFIGSHLVDALVSGRNSVICIDDLSTGCTANLTHARKLAEKNAAHFRVAIGDAGRLLRHFIKDADLVFHLAAVVGVERVMENPSSVLLEMHETTRRVVQECTTWQKRLVMTSTSEVYGRNPDMPFVETQDCHIGPPTNARWSYALVKLADEFLALEAHRSHGLPVTLARLFNTVGPRQSAAYGMVLPRFVKQALAGEKLTIHGDGSQSRCFAHVRDIVKCLLLLSQPGHEGEIFNVGSTEEITIQELALNVIGAARGLGQTFDPLQDFDFIPARSTDMARRVPDVSKLKAAIGYAPNTPLARIVEDVVEGMRKAGGAPKDAPETLKR